MAGCELSVGAAGLIFFQEQGALHQEKRARKKMALAKQARMREATELAVSAEEKLLIDLTEQEGAKEKEPEPEKDPLDPQEVARSLQEHLQEEEMEQGEDDDDDVEGIAELIEKQQDEAEAMAVDKDGSGGSGNAQGAGGAQITSSAGALVGHPASQD